MVTTRRAGAATTANSTEDRFAFADFKLIGALGTRGRSGTGTGEMFSATTR